MNKHLVSFLVGAAAAGGIFTNISPAQALVWNLNNVTFAAGGTASGSFDYDVSTNTYSNINISVSGLYTRTFSIATSPGTNPTIFSSSANQLNLEFDTGVAGPERYQGLRLSFASPLTNTLESTVNIRSGIPSFQYFNDVSQLGGGPLDLLSVRTGSSVVSVPFDIPGGAAIPTVGSLFALGVMRQVKKKMAAKNIVTNPVSETVN